MGKVLHTRGARQFRQLDPVGAPRHRPLPCVRVQRRQHQHPPGIRGRQVHFPDDTKRSHGL